MTITNNDLAIQRTKFSNQRTYLAYMRTGFGIAALAGTFKKFWIMTFGLIMIIMSSLQYVMINNSLSDKKKIKNTLFDKLPLIYIVLSLGALYLQFNK
tara:strand:+ start:422 stop:715 length:294 start_codon:yes stop_codon:yes gene_type:complete